MPHTNTDRRTSSPDASESSLLPPTAVSGGRRFDPAPPPSRGIEGLSSHIPALAALLALLTACSAWAHSISLRDPYGRLRNGIPVAIVGSDLKEMVVAPDLDHARIVRFGEHGMIADEQDLRNGEPVKAVPSNNWIEVSGIDRKSKEPVARQFQIWGDSHGSLLLQAKLFEVENLPDGLVRLRLLIAPEQVGNPTAIGRIMHRYTNVLVFEDRELEATFEVESVEFSGRSYPVTDPQWQGRIIGSGDCPFGITTKPTRLSPRISGRLLRASIANLKPDLLVVISGLAAMPDGKPSAYFAEAVWTGVLTDADRKALEGPHDCAWAPLDQAASKPEGEHGQEQVQQAQARQQEQDGQQPADSPAAKSAAAGDGDDQAKQHSPSDP